MRFAVQRTHSRNNWIWVPVNLQPFFVSTPHYHWMVSVNHVLITVVIGRTSYRIRILRSAKSKYSDSENTVVLYSSEAAARNQHWREAESKKSETQSRCELGFTIYIWMRKPAYRLASTNSIVNQSKSTIGPFPHIDSDSSGSPTNSMLKCNFTCTKIPVAHLDKSEEAELAKAEDPDSLILKTSIRG